MTLNPRSWYNSYKRRQLQDEISELDLKINMATWTLKSTSIVFQDLRGEIIDHRSDYVHRKYKLEKELRKL